MDPVAIAMAPNLSDQVGNIPKLIETDFQMWKVSVEIVVGCMELDLALRPERPKSTPEDPNEAEIKKWNRSNQMCLMVMKRALPKAFWGLVEKDSAREFLDEIEPYFAKNDNPDAAKLFADLISMKYEGEGSVQKYILEVSRLALKLKSLEFELSQDFLVSLILMSLPARFEQLKTYYNTQIYKWWSMDELLSRCMLEEEIQLLFGTVGSSHSATSPKSQECQMPVFGKIGRARVTSSPKLQKKIARKLQERKMSADSATFLKLHKETKKSYDQQKKKDEDQFVVTKKSFNQKIQDKVVVPMCYLCNNSGHAKRNCPHKKANHRYGAVSL